jgi:CTP-dependent riboflavin kinase
MNELEHNEHLESTLRLLARVEALEKQAKETKKHIETRAIYSHDTRQRFFELRKAFLFLIRELERDGQLDRVLEKYERFVLTFQDREYYKAALGVDHIRSVDQEDEQL